MRTPQRSCLAALHAESIVRSFLTKEARTAISRFGVGSGEFKIGEETITEAMLLDLADKYADVVEVMLFSKSFEARRTGADWLWCFETPTGNHFMLVQAKRPEEPMSHSARSWTIKLPTTKNKTTRKTQHKTLLDSAKALGVTPIYCLFMPAMPTSGCAALEGVDFEELYSHWPHWGPRSRGFVPISRASAWSEGSHSVIKWDPPGITLTALVCCTYRQRGTLKASNERPDDYWDMQGADLSFDPLVGRILNMGAESGVKGIVKFRVGGPNEQ
jgi:hypothetical protein